MNDSHTYRWDGSKSNRIPIDEFEQRAAQALKNSGFTYDRQDNSYRNSMGISATVGIRRINFRGDKIITDTLADIIEGIDGIPLIIE